MSDRLADLEHETALLLNELQGEDDGADDGSLATTGTPQAKKAKLHMLDSDDEDLVALFDGNIEFNSVDDVAPQLLFTTLKPPPKDWAPQVEQQRVKRSLPDTSTGRALAINQLYQAELEKQLAILRQTKQRLTVELKVHQAGLGPELSVGRPSLAQATAYKELSKANPCGREPYQAIFVGQLELQRVSAVHDNYLQTVNGTESPLLTGSDLYDQTMARFLPFYRDPEPWPAALRRKLRAATIKQLKTKAIADVFQKPMYQSLHWLAKEQYKSDHHALRMKLVQDQLEMEARPDDCFTGMEVDNVDWDLIASTISGKTAEDCKLKWMRDECSSAKRKWPKEEDAMLLRLVKDHPGKDFGWYAAELAKKLPHLPARKRIDTIVRYQRHLNKERQKVKWTKEDDQRLTAIMADIPSRDWMQASRLMKDRTGPQCMHRWLKSIDPSISRSKWRKEEDLKLAEGVAQYGKVWAKVQRLLPNRTDMQCRERFVNVLAKREDMASRANLDDSITWRRGRWVPEEDAKLLEIVESFGAKWSLVARAMGESGFQRDDSQCLRRWGNLKPKEYLLHLRKVKAKRETIAANRAQGKRRLEESSLVEPSDLGVQPQDIRLGPDQERRIQQQIDYREAIESGTSGPVPQRTSSRSTAPQPPVATVNPSMVGPQSAERIAQTPPCTAVMTPFPGTFRLVPGPNGLQLAPMRGAPSSVASTTPLTNVQTNLDGPTQASLPPPTTSTTTTTTISSTAATMPLTASPLHLDTPEMYHPMQSQALITPASVTLTVAEAALVCSLVPRANTSRRALATSLTEPLSTSSTAPPSIAPPSTAPLSTSQTPSTEKTRLTGASATVVQQYPAVDDTILPTSTSTTDGHQ
eukprot:m.153647 g.153647  ORF g.153647 m.153647 type:complete len:867 (+) comp16371_c0_seq23:131-2731(+)